MPVFSVDTQAVADTAYRTRARISTIQTEVDAMNSDIATLQSSWTGAASDSMAVCAADWSLWKKTCPIAALTRVRGASRQRHAMLNWPRLATE